MSAVGQDSQRARLNAYGVNMISPGKIIGTPTEGRKIVPNMSFVVIILMSSILLTCWVFIDNVYLKNAVSEHGRS